VSEIRGTTDLQEFNRTYAPHSGSPKVFPKQLAVVINSELERAIVYACHLESCQQFDLSEGDEDCSCGLAALLEYVRRLAPHRYDPDGSLNPKYAPE
jgi:hypothetical protein